tara:strand:+ start:2592 stop:3014 length:423 start_codon:yes stop_codon:yes gene_type:complete
MDKINWSKFAIYHTDDKDLDCSENKIFPFIEESKYRAINTGINEPTVQINFEDFYKGPDIIWTLSHDEVHYLTKGKAEIICYLPPLMKEKKEAIAKTGSIYLLPRGCRVVWKIIGEEPFRHFCICFPNPGYPSKKGKSIE